MCSKPIYLALSRAQQLSLSCQRYQTSDYKVHMYNLRWKLLQRLLRSNQLSSSKTGFIGEAASEAASATAAEASEAAAEAGTTSTAVAATAESVAPTVAPSTAVVARVAVAAAAAAAAAARLNAIYRRGICSCSNTRRQRRVRSFL